MFQHRIENRQQLPHARRERDLIRFARSLQPLIEGANHRIESGGDDGAHIEDGADLCASAPHGASPSERAAIAIEWRDTDEGGDLLVRQCAQFRKTGQQGRGQYGAYPRHTLQEFVFAPPHGALANRLRQLRVGALELPFEQDNMSPYALADRRGRAQEAILFGRQHSTSCRRRVKTAASARVSASGIGRGSGRSTSANCASTWASRASVFANRPLALAKSRT